VAYARSPEIMQKLHEYFTMDGVSRCFPKPMGGNVVLQIWWIVAQWFDVVRHCDSILSATERFVWLGVEGVPLHAWDGDFF